MRKYFDPELKIREFNLENIVTESGVPTLTVDENVGSIDGATDEELGDALFF